MENFGTSSGVRVCSFNYYPKTSHSWASVHESLFRCIKMVLEQDPLHLWETIPRSIKYWLNKLFRLHLNLTSIKLVLVIEVDDLEQYEEEEVVYIDGFLPRYDDGYL